MSKIIVREFSPSKDSGFIYSTFPKSVFYSGINVRKAFSTGNWFKEFHVYMQHLLPEADISIACMQDDPQTIMGYSIISGPTLHFIYIKEKFRKQGIATLLLKLSDGIQDINFAFITKVGAAIINDHPEVFKTVEKEGKHHHEHTITDTH